MNKNNIKVKILKTAYYEKVQNFILRNHAQLENKDFFIIDDIQTSLPAVFGEDGIIVAAFNNDDEIVAIQAVDFSNEVQQSLATVLSDGLMKVIYAEMGWTMTDAHYQNQGIAKFLISSLEDIIAQQSKQILLVATIHPNNIKSLRLYLHLGYIGITLQSHFGLPRIYLIKEINKTPNLDYTNEITVKTMDGLTKAFNCDYILKDLDYKGKELQYVFYKKGN